MQTQGTDLGCDATYSKRRAKKVHKKRWDKAKNKLQKLAGTKGPRKHKARVAKVAGHSCALYGQETTYQTEHQWQTLRTASAKAVTLAQPGSSPWLALAAYSPTLDPQLSGALRRMQFWRKYIRVFPHREAAIHRRLQHQQRGNGPIAALSRTMQNIGWSFPEAGTMEHETGHRCPWTTCTAKYLRATLEAAWSHQVLKKTAHRKHMDMTNSDGRTVAKLVQKMNEEDQGLIQAHLGGAHYTHEVLQKFARGLAPTCPFCNQEDSHYHRLVQCPGLQHERLEHQETIQWLRTQPRAVATYGLCPKVETFRRDRTQVTPTMSPRIVPDRREDREERAQAFVDGSSYMQAHPDFTIAASAAIIVQDMSYRPKKIVTQLMPGADHNSYRAETYAIYLALQSEHTLKIYCDCAAAVTVFQTLQEHHRRGTQPQKISSWDLWEGIWQHIKDRPHGAVEIQKIKAHQQHQETRTARQEWERHWNDQVDAQAKEQVVTAPLYQEAAEQYRRQQATEKRMEDLYKYILTLSRKALQAKAGGKEPSQLAAIKSWEDQIARGPCIRAEPIAVPDKKFPYNDTFLARIVKWYNTLEWPTPQSNESRPISLLELYFDYVLETQTLAPVKVSAQGKYYLRDQDTAADLTQNKLSQQHNIWVRSVKWMSQNIPQMASHSYCKERCLAIYGYGQLHDSIKPRPKLNHGEAVYKLLQAYFVQGEGTRNNMAAPFHL